MEISSIEEQLQAQESLNSSTFSQTNDYGLNPDLLINKFQDSIQYNEILFVDSAVKDYQSLIDNLNKSTEIVILNSQDDGIFQITNHLKKYNDLNAVHIVSHGDSGKLFLGNAIVENDTLPEYIDWLNSWSNHIDQDGDILLYGCNVAADLAGLEFVESLSEYTQADIQASNDLTGSSELDGDWYLEYATDNIEAELIFDNQVISAYENILDNSINLDIQKI